MRTHDTADHRLIERIRALRTPLDPVPTRVLPRTRTFPDIRAVLFDVYGTLVISASGDIDALPEANAADAHEAAKTASGLASGAFVRNAGPELLKDEIRATHARLRSQGIEFPEVDILEIWRKQIRNPGSPAIDVQLRRLAVEYEFRVNPVCPMPGLSALLHSLQSRGMILGIVSNAQFYTPLMLEAFLSAPLEARGFLSDHCSWSYHVGQAKPSLAIYTPLLARLHDLYHLEPRQILYVGNDMRNDVYPANELRLNTVLFAGDRRSLRLREDDPKASHCQPDAVITTLPQLVTDLLAPP